MTESELRELFRRALRASLALPLVAGGAACSDSTTQPSASDAGHDGAGRHDARRDAHTSSDAARDAGGPDVAKRDAGRDAAHVDAGGSDAKEDTAAHDGGRPDSATHDAARDVATKHDAPPEPCTSVTLQGGCDVEIAVTCFDGGLAIDAAYSPDECSNKLCPSSSDGFDCQVLGFDGGPLLVCQSLSGSCTNGRAYAGMVAPALTHPTAHASPVGRFFAETAHLEAASIDAFRILRHELRAHAAPSALVTAAQRAARDEVRHARTMAKLARRYGSTAVRPRAGARVARPLADVAEENAVEGCVRETYAALLAHFQALASEDAEVRDAMAVIADDETRHAALAWAVAAWADPRLDDRARERVAQARGAAVEQLKAALRSYSAPPPLATTAGLPAPSAALRMVEVLDNALWARMGETPRQLPPLPHS